MNISKLRSLEGYARKTLADAREITDAAKAAGGRALTEDEENRVKALLGEVDRVKPEILSLRETAREAEAIRASGKATGWDAVAKVLSKAHTVGNGGRIAWEGQLKDVDVKTATITDLTDNATRKEPGIRPLLSDDRRFHSLLPSLDPGNAALHVESFSITSSGLAAGSAAVERDPLSIAAKAEADVVVAIEEIDLRQFAILSGDLPNAAFRAVSELRRIMEAAMGRELDSALDAHAVAALEASTPDVEPSGSDLVSKIRHGKSTLRSRGVEGQLIAVIGDTEAAELDLILPDQLPSGFPFGVTVAVVPDAVINGNAYLMAANAMRKYRGAARIDANPFGSFDTNQTSLRMEFEAVCVVQESSAILDLVGIS